VDADVCSCGVDTACAVDGSVDMAGVGGCSDSLVVVDPLTRSLAWLNV
jgi:hypothetical protein